jgi:hypothetical protein
LGHIYKTANPSNQPNHIEQKGENQVFKLHHLAKVPAFLMAGFSCACLFADDLKTAEGAPPAKRLAIQDARHLIVILEPICGADITPTVKMTIWSTLQQHIVNSQKTRSFDRGRTDIIDESLQAQHFTMNGKLDKGKAVEIGKQFSADTVCVSEVQKEKDRYVLNCSFIDAETAEVFASSTQVVGSKTLQEMKTGTERAARTLLRFENPKKILAREQAHQEEREQQKAEREQQRVDDDKREDYRTDAFTDLGQRERDARRTSEEIEAARLARERAPISEQSIRDAKATVNRLMPRFKIQKKGNQVVSFVSELFWQYEDSQKKFYENFQDPYGYYSIFASFSSDKLEIQSKWIYRPTWAIEIEKKKGKTKIIQAQTMPAERENEAERKRVKDLRLNHNALVVSINQKMATVMLSPTKKSRAKTPAAPRWAIVEKCVIEDDGILQMIAANREQRIPVEVRGFDGLQKFDLNRITQEGIVQTIELYNAMRHLKKAGIEFQEKYALW